MSESDANSLIGISTQGSDASFENASILQQHDQSQNPPPGANNPHGCQPMETDDNLPDHHANKRKRADTNPEDNDTSPPARSLSRQSPQSFPPNQLGISYHSQGYASPTSNSPAHDNRRLSNLSIGSNISTAVFHNNATTSTPRYPHPGQPAPSTANLEPANRPPEKIENLDVTGFLGDNPLTGLDPIVISSWKELGDLKALIYPHDASYSEEEKGLIAEKMELAIAHHLNCHRPLVTTPKAAKNYESRKTDNRRPWCYLVTRLSEENLDTIIKDRFISNHHATLHVLPFSPHPSHYIGRIKNLTFAEKQQKNVIALIQQTLEDSSTVKNFIDDFTSAHHDLIPGSVYRRGKTRDYIIKSARAFYIEGEGISSKAYYQWNWYILTPTKEQEHIASWTKFFADIIFNAGVHGVGDTVTTLKCTRCKSTNHVEVECPFSKRSDHIRSPPSNNKPTRNTRGGRGGKRGGNRGGGRGRTYHE